MALAIGGSPPAPVVSSSPLRIDATQPPYGCKADNGATDNAPYLQAALDAAGALAASTYRTVDVYLPGAEQSYILNDTVSMDKPRVRLVGDGRDKTALAIFAVKDAIRLGVRRIDTTWGTPIEIGLPHRPDAYGVLDAGACPAPGRKWGIDTLNKAFGQFQGSPLSHGPLSSRYGSQYCDNWSETNQLTWEFFIEPTSGPYFPQQARLLGVGTMGINPTFCLGTDFERPGIFWVRFKTSEMPQTTDSQHAREFRFSVVDIPSPWRITIQFDLANAIVSVFVNGTQVALALSTNMTASATWPFVAGLNGFYANDHYPFLIGADGSSGSLGGPGTKTGMPMRLWGMRLSNVTRYQVNGVGTSEVRTDSPSSVIDDTYRYFTSDSHTIAYLQLDDDPATLTRNIAVRHGGAAGGDSGIGGKGGGVFMSAEFGGGVGPNAINGMNVNVLNFPYATPISVGAVIDLDLEDVRAGGGWCAIGSWNTIANYTIRGRRLWLDKGSDCVYYGFSQILFLDDIQISNTGRVGFRFVGCNAHVDRVFAQNPGANGEHVVKCQGYGYGGMYELRRFLVDFEGNTLQKSVIYCENTSEFGTRLIIDEFLQGSMGPIPLIDLKDTSTASGSSNLAYVDIHNVGASNAASCIVQVDGPLWYGTLRGYTAGSGRVVPPINQLNTFGLSTGIQVLGGALRPTL